MAVSWVKETAITRDGTIDLSRRDYVRRFLVLTTANTDDQTTVYNADDGSVAVPTQGTPHPNDSNSYAQIITPRQQPQNPRLWEVMVYYSTELAGTPLPQNPLDRPADVSWRNVKATEPIRRDVMTDAPIANSAGDEFDPYITRQVSRMALVISRNESVFNTTQAANYTNSVNSDWFFVEPGQAKCEAITADLQYDFGTSYWRVSYEFHFHERGWQAEILDQGLYAFTYSIPPEGDPVLVYGPIVDRDTGSPVTTPQLLDGTGQAIDKREPYEPVYLEYNRYRTLPFAALDLIG